MKKIKLIICIFAFLLIVYSSIFLHEITHVIISYTLNWNVHGFAVNYPFISGCFLFKFDDIYLDCASHLSSSFGQFYGGATYIDEFGDLNQSQIMLFEFPAYFLQFLFITVLGLKTKKWYNE